MEVSSNILKIGNRAPQKRSKALSWSLLGVTKSVWQSDVATRILSSALFSFLTYNILLSLLPLQYPICLPQRHFCLHPWKHRILTPDSDNTFTNTCFTSTSKKTHNKNQKNPKQPKYNERNYFDHKVKQISKPKLESHKTKTKDGGKKIGGYTQRWSLLGGKNLWMQKHWQSTANKVASSPPWPQE